MASKNWTTKVLKFQLSGDSKTTRVDDPTTPIVVSVVSGTMNASVVSSVDGATLETLTLSAPSGISLLTPTDVFGNYLVFTAVAADSEIRVLKLT